LPVGAVLVFVGSQDNNKYGYEDNKNACPEAKIAPYFAE
jgi:hypothetical protein